MSKSYQGIVERHINALRLPPPTDEPTLLLGGVTAVRSSWFEERGDAVNWLMVTVEGNLEAHRPVGRVWIREWDREPEIRHKELI